MELPDRRERRHAGASAAVAAVVTAICINMMVLDAVFCGSRATVCMSGGLEMRKVSLSGGRAGRVMISDTKAKSFPLLLVLFFAVPPSVRRSILNFQCMWNKLRRESAKFDWLLTALAPTSRARANSGKCWKYWCDNPRVWRVICWLLRKAGLQLEHITKSLLVPYSKKEIKGGLPAMLSAFSKFAIVTCYQDDIDHAWKLLGLLGCTYGLEFAYHLKCCLLFRDSCDAYEVNCIQNRIVASIRAEKRVRRELMGVAAVAADEDDDDDDDEEIDPSLEEDECRKIKAKLGVETIEPLVEGDTIPAGELIVRRGWVEHRAKFCRMKVVNGSLVSVRRFNGRDCPILSTERSGGMCVTRNPRAELEAAVDAILRGWYPGHHSDTSSSTWWSSFVCRRKSCLFANGDDWEVKFIVSGEGVEEEDRLKGWSLTGGRVDTFLTGE